ncbi:MAG: TonB-dependent receptor, partial [Pseudomonadota bacterium]
VRGMGVSSSVPSFDPAVGLFVDGAYRAQSASGVLDVFDVEQIEILRGPQGTLFGRNVTGGAITLRTRRPTDELDVRAQVTVGRFDRVDGNVSISGPLVEDTLSGKIAVLYRTTDGFVNDLANDGRVGDLDRLIVRPALKLTPSENFDITLIGEYIKEDGDGPASVSIPDQGNPLLAAMGGSRGFFDTFLNLDRMPLFLDNESVRITADANWDLGHGVITSITSYSQIDNIVGGDFDGTQLFISETRTFLDQNQFSQELRYASSFSEVFDFTVGLFYFTQDYLYGEQRFGGAAVSATNPNGATSPILGLTDHNQFSAFVEGHVNITEALTLTLGGRYTWEEKDAQIGLIGSGNCVSSGEFILEPRVFSCPGGFDVEDSEDWTNFSPKIGLDFKITDDIITYASWTRGFRSGGFAFRAPLADLALDRPALYDEERVDGFEVGLKSSFADNRIRFNAAGFINLFDGLQRSVFTGAAATAGIFQRTQNIDDARIMGLEFEFFAVVGESLFTDGDSLIFDASLGLLDAEYQSFVDFTGDGVDNRDFEVDFVPEYNFATSVTYQHPVFNDAGTFNYRVALTQNPSFQTAANNNPLGVRAAQTLLDASFGFKSEDNRYSIRVFGQNLLNDEFVNIPVPFTPAFGVGYLGRPRTWGVEFGLDF